MCCVKDSSDSANGLAEPRPVRYADLGGIEAVLSDIKELVEYPLRHPEVPSPSNTLDCLQWLFSALLELGTKRMLAQPRALGQTCNYHECCLPMAVDVHCK